MQKVTKNLKTDSVSFRIVNDDLLQRKFSILGIKLNVHNNPLFEGIRLGQGFFG